MDTTRLVRVAFGLIATSVAHAGCDDAAGRGGAPSDQCAGTKCDNVPGSPDAMGEHDDAGEEFTSAAGRLAQCLASSDDLVVAGRLDPERYTSSDDAAAKQEDLKAAKAALASQDECLRNVLSDDQIAHIEDELPGVWDDWLADRLRFAEKTCTLVGATHTLAMGPTLMTECANRFQAVSYQVMLNALDLGVHDAGSHAAEHYPSCLEGSDGQRSVTDAQAALQCVRDRNADVMKQARANLETEDVAADAIERCLDVREAQATLAQRCTALVGADGVSAEDEVGAILCQVEVESVVAAIFSSIRGFEGPSGYGAAC